MYYSLMFYDRNPQNQFNLCQQKTHSLLHSDWHFNMSMEKEKKHNTFYIDPCVWCTQIQIFLPVIRVYYWICMKNLTTCLVNTILIAVVLSTVLHLASIHLLIMTHHVARSSWRCQIFKHTLQMMWKHFA